jgi:cholest-4-en-3-one 26-monooxygenase
MWIPNTDLLPRHCTRHYSWKQKLGHYAVMTAAARQVRADSACNGQAEPAYRPANFISGYESLPVRFSPGPAVGQS